MDPAAAASADGGAFLEFVDYAISMLSSSGGDGDESPGDGPAPARPPWGWAVAQVLKSCCAYSSGVTAAIILSDLFQSWSEQRKSLTSKRKVELTKLINTRNKRRRLPNTVTIDSIHEKNFLSPKSVLEAVVIDVFVLPGTNIYMLTLGDMWSASTIDLYLHRRFYDYIGQYGLLKKGREVMLTGCCLRTAMEGSGHARILPTEYMVILLDEAKDEDAMLLAAQFCAYSFSSMISEENRHNVPYSFYARIEKIESLEPFRCTERKQIVLVDSDDTKMGFILWGEQVLLANLFSVGSMLALDRPYIANCVDSNHEESQELCLEYGSAHRFMWCQLLNKKNSLEVSWREKEPGSLFVNLSLLPALLNSSCLHNLAPLSDLPRLTNRTHICRVRLGCIDCNSLRVLLFHNICGCVVNEHSGELQCSFCKGACRRECAHGFQLHLPIADDSAKLFAWCVGQTAVEFLQISPDEYLELPEVQALKLVDRIMPK
nr:unnamed protein product [Digitaria exilis]